MAVKRKRAASSDLVDKPSKKVEAVGDTLDSDEETSQKGGSGSEAEDDGLYETPDEMRVRLAKEYLSKVGDGKTQDEVHEQLTNEMEEKERKTRKQIEEVKLGEPRLLKGHKMAVTCVCLSSDEATAFSGGKDCHLMRWDLETGKRVAFPGGRKKFECGGHFAEVLGASLVESRQLLCSASADRTVRLWDHRAPDQSKCQQALLGHEGAVTAVVTDEDGNQIFTASADKSLKVWDVRRSRRCMDTLFGHVSGVTCMDIYGKGRPVTGGADKTVRLWKTDKETHLMFSKHVYSVDAVAMVDQDRCLSGSQDGNIFLWSSGSKKPVAVASLGSNWVTALGAVRRGNVAFSSGLDGKLRCWRFARGSPGVRRAEKPAEKLSKEDQKVKLTEVMTPIPVPGLINAIAVGQKTVVCAVGREHRLGRWNYDRAKKNGVLVMPLAYQET